MAEYNPAQGGLILPCSEKYRNELDIEAFSLMMKDPSYCYKFYWLEAIVKLISEGVETTDFGTVIDEMIANAWYSVREFHIHLSGMPGGEVRDGLERAVNLLAELSNLPSQASKTEIKNAIAANASELKACREQLTNMVPYRALAGFFRRVNEPAEWSSPVRMVNYIERVNKTIELPYVLGTGSKLKKEIIFSSAWMNMIQDNTVAILGWIQYEKVRWLQANNPEVPGLVYKLAPLDVRQRKLEKVRRLWEAVLDIRPVHDVFTDGLIAKGAYDVDHFVPWSFVMNDELWNLMPMDSSLNSSKSNLLPEWYPFFGRFAANQYLLYRLIQDRDEMHRLFEQCWKDNLHSIWAVQELYRPGNSEQVFCSILESNMRPVYDSARRQGYGMWSFGQTQYSRRILTHASTLSRVASPKVPYNTEK